MKAVADLGGYSGKSPGLTPLYLPLLPLTGLQSLYKGQGVSTLCDWFFSSLFYFGK